jgi:hypothetical protein
LKNAQDKAGAAKSGLASLELKAPFGGTVISLNLKAGAFVQAGIEVAKLADTSSWLVKTSDLTELNVVKIAPGMTATVKLDALPDVQMTAQVESIEKFGQNHQSDIVYTVVLELNQPDPRLPVEYERNRDFWREVIGANIYPYGGSLWHCFWIKTITRFGFAIFHWNYFPHDNSGVDPSQFFVEFLHNLVQSFPGLHAGKGHAGFVALDVDSPFLHIEDGFCKD